MLKPPVIQFHQGVVLRVCKRVGVWHCLRGLHLCRRRWGRYIFLASIDHVTQRLEGGSRPIHRKLKMHVEVRVGQPVPASLQSAFDIQIRPAPNLGLAVEQAAEIQSFLESALPPCVAMEELRGFQTAITVYIMLVDDASTDAFANLLGSVLRALERAGVPVLGIPVAQPLWGSFTALTLPGTDLVVSVQRGK